MKVLIINKFLKPKGGSETYIIKIGDCLKQKGHQVQYFGMDEPGRTLGNRVNQYTASLDFHTTGFKRFCIPLKSYIPGKPGKSLCWSWRISGRMRCISIISITS